MSIPSFPFHLRLRGTTGGPIRLQCRIMPGCRNRARAEKRRENLRWMEEGRRNAHGTQMRNDERQVCWVLYPINTAQKQKNRRTPGPRTAPNQRKPNQTLSLLNRAGCNLELSTLIKKKKKKTRIKCVLPSLLTLPFINVTHFRDRRLQNYGTGRYCVTATIIAANSI